MSVGADDSNPRPRTTINVLGIEANSSPASFSTIMAFQLCAVPMPLSLPTHWRGCTGRRPGCVLVRAARPGTSPELSLTQLANYQPTTWGYEFLQSVVTNSVGEMHKKRHEELKEFARQQIVGESGLAMKLELIDVVQRLGLGYQFDEEIKNVLGSVSVEEASVVLKEDLHTIALLFRLLREHGFQISHDIFNGFKDNKGGFTGCIRGGYQGMLSLYEASHLSFKGEITLDEAIDSTKVHLTYLKSKMDLHLQSKVEHALELPLNFRDGRLEARWYIEKYKNYESMDESLLLLAKLDFNKVQSIHRKEIKELSRWWKKLGLGDQLSTFARDRLVECFYFAAGIVSDPHLGYSRQAVAKVFAIVAVLDDVYDIYGSLNDLTLLTSVINGWEDNLVEQLPDYMKTCYSALCETINNMAQDVLMKEDLDVLPYLKNAWVDLCNAFFVEAKWKYSGYTPTLDEYISNGWMSVSGPLMLVHALILSGQGVTKETLKFMEDYSILIRTSSTIFRLCNDLATSTAELERGDIPTSLQCYMKKYGVSEADGRRGINKLIKEEWKSLNKAASDYSKFPGFFKKEAIGLGRISHCMYQNGDGLGVPDQEKDNQISSLFFEELKL